jgi:HemY protein
MNQALKAPRDPAWTADGITAPEWRAVSPVTGRLDAFEWKTPVSPLEGPIEEGSPDAVDEAIRTLPPLAIEEKPAVKVAEVAEIEKAETEKPVIVAAVVEPVPVKTVTPEKAPVEAVEEKEERPFYGLPDDPGVKEGTDAKRDGTSGFRLF